MSAFCFLLLLYRSFLKPEMQSRLSSMQTTYNLSFPPALDLAISQQSKLRCNPFASPGLLRVNLSDADQNYWEPHERSCAASRLMTALRSSSTSLPVSNEDQFDMSFLYNKTVVLLGDSVDREHLSQFCMLSFGEATWINSGHELSPPAWNGRDENFREDGDAVEDEWLSRPWMCRIERFDFVMVQVFSYGLMNAEDHPRKFWAASKHYYPPFSLLDRFEHILLPILTKLDRSSIDLLELGSSFWDLAWFTARWEVEGFNYVENSVRHKDLSQWGSLLSTRLRSLARMALKTQTILYRTPHQTGHNYDGYLPAWVLSQMGSVSDAVVNGLSGHLKEKPFFAAPEWDWDADVRDAESLGMKTKLRLDFSGQMMTGHQRYMADHLHPDLLPNGKVYSDIILYELQRIS